MVSVKFEMQATEMSQEDYFVLLIDTLLAANPSSLTFLRRSNPMSICRKNLCLRSAYEDTQLIESFGHKR